MFSSTMFGWMFFLCVVTRVFGMEELTQTYPEYLQEFGKRKLAGTYSYTGGFYEDAVDHGEEPKYKFKVSAKDNDKEQLKVTWWTNGYVGPAPGSAVYVKEHKNLEGNIIKYEWTVLKNNIKTLTLTIPVKEKMIEYLNMHGQSVSMNIVGGGNTYVGNNVGIQNMTSSSSVENANEIHREAMETNVSIKHIYTPSSSFSVGNDEFGERKLAGTYSYTGGLYDEEHKYKCKVSAKGTLTVTWPNSEVESAAGGEVSVKLLKDPERYQWVVKNVMTLTIPVEGNTIKINGNFNMNGEEYNNSSYSSVSNKNNMYSSSSNSVGIKHKYPSSSVGNKNHTYENKNLYGGDVYSVGIKNQYEGNNSNKQYIEAMIRRDKRLKEADIRIQKANERIKEANERIKEANERKKATGNF